MIEASGGVCTPFWEQPGHQSWIRPPGAHKLTMSAMAPTSSPHTLPTPVVPGPLIRAQAAAWSATLPALPAPVPMFLDIATQHI
jgi:hypothetical protein